MRQLMISLGISLFLHGVLLSMVPGWAKNKPEVRILAQYITLVPSYDKNEVTLPITERPTEDIKQRSIPPPLLAPARLTEFQGTVPVKKIQTKAQPAAVLPA